MPKLKYKLKAEPFNSHCLGRGCSDDGMEALRLVNELTKQYDDLVKKHNAVVDELLSIKTNYCRK